VQKLIERVPAERLSFIPAFKGSVFELSTHPYGCRVLQRCFEHLSEEQTRPLMDELHKYIINLMQDQFGVRLMLGQLLSSHWCLICFTELRRTVCSRIWQAA